MEKLLNTTLVEEKLAEHGLSQTALAKKVGKTKAAVSKWLTGKSFPRPAELLKLGKLLGASYKELVVSAQQEPIVAFRKRASCKTTPEHIRRAKDIGVFLEPLVEYLEFDKFVGPAKLKAPTTDYSYLQELVSKIRRELDISDDEPIDFLKLIDKFHEHQAVIVPVMWGKKQKHENALHIYLPKSKTTWIYLNLDSDVHDFKFWMAHELGHVLSVNLLEEERSNDAEDFADAFAGALLFPKAAVEIYFPKYKAAKTDRSRMKILCEAAEEYLISPFSVYKEMEAYAKALEVNFNIVAKACLHSSIAEFNKRYQMLSEVLFDGKTPSADHFMRVAQESFGTEFYKALGAYLRASDAPPNTVSKIMDVSLMDGRAFYDALASA